ncbi:MAG TPA: SAM-dependent methyltransferase [Chloroflexota bacterium]|nr:SAM-dependent methyltransferase [Chloroflexota bacterium]
MVRRKPITVVEAVRRGHPDLEDPESAIAAGSVLVDGMVRTNAATLVRSDATVTIVGSVPLRGEAKLRAALDRFDVRVDGRICLDVGAAAGGFTRVLLGAGARRVYAVDAGHGQLLGSLRLDARVVNLESTNLGELTTESVPDEIEVFSVDVSYVSLSAAVPQLSRVAIASQADLIALVKPMFELRLAGPPEEPPLLDEALRMAIAGIEAASWKVIESMDSPVTGARGAREMLIHARRLV